MTSTDTAYYRQRAVTERALAKATKNQNVAAIHEELARQYQALVDQIELRPLRRRHLSVVPSESNQSLWHANWKGLAEIQTIGTKHRR
jgi:hypothetical protein